MEKIKYLVEVVETLARTIEVEAENEDIAIEVVKEMYRNSEIILDSNDLSGEADYQIISSDE